MTVLLTIDPQYPKKRLIQQVAEVLRDGGVIAYPTDTTYGIGCNLYDRRAIERVYRIKKKDRKKPLSFICADLTDLSKYAQVDTWAYKIMRKLLPGPYTFILQASREVPKILMTNRLTVGIRVPDNAICSEILKELTWPIISTSVRSGEGDIFTDPVEIDRQLGSQLDLVIDGGILLAEPSTVVDLMQNPPEIVRVGKGDISWFQT